MTALRLQQFRQSIGSVFRPSDREAELGCGSAVVRLICPQAVALQDALICASPMHSKRQSQRKDWRAVPWDYSDLFRQQEAISRFGPHAPCGDNE